jgi:membrane fusion protein (multidrug efflux system)
MKDSTKCSPRRSIALKRLPRVRSIVAVGLGTAFLLGGVSCKKQVAAAAPPPSVQVLEVSATNASMTTEFIGQLDAPENVQIRARVEGFIDKVTFIEGTNVVAGQTLFLIDKKPFQERLAAAECLLGEARAALNKYEKDVARLTPLAAKKAIPQQDLDNAQASVEVGKAGVVSAEARVASAKLDLGYCTVQAPIDGLIGAKQVSEGQLVGRGEPTLLATMSRLDPIWFYCAVGEMQYLKADNEVRKKGRNVMDLPVSLILADSSVHPDEGRFVFIDRAVDSKTGTLRVRAEFKNSGGLLRPGMFGRIKVDLGGRPDSILVPERALAELQGKNFVWLVDKDNKTTQRPVEVGEVIDGKVLVMNGLKPGDRIVVEGLQKVREGGVVQPELEPVRKMAAARPEEIQQKRNRD